jgi:hypothetical protein
MQIKAAGILAFPLLAGIEIFQNSHHHASL